MPHTPLSQADSSRSLDAARQAVRLAAAASDRAQGWWQEMRDVRWGQMLAVLRARFLEARLGVSASSLTFTMVLALVPLFAVALSLFTAFPMFGKFQDTVQRWLVESLVPESISRQVLGYLTQFARKASRLGVVGLVAVVLTSVALMATIERTLGQIWGVQRRRRLAQRVLLYWAAITLGPLILGASLGITSYVVAASRDVAVWLPAMLRWLLDSVEFLLLALCIAGLYFYVPNATVRWRHAFTAGVLAALGIELAKKLLTLYLAEIPTYSAIYGAFAVVPILLVWIYLAWLVVLLGAVVAASLPEMGRHGLRRADAPGDALRVALQVLQALDLARQDGRKGLTTPTLMHALRLRHQDLSSVLETLQALDWIGVLRDDGGAAGSRLVLLVTPSETSLAPLVNALMLQRPATGADPLWQALQLDRLTLADVLARGATPAHAA
ncbi:MAG: hypothetical protein RIQ38_498 [Pseudomonadota bacterium]|jgi:membrane protein